MSELPLTSSIGLYFRRLRIERRLTLTEVSGAIDRSISWLSGVERGKISPPLESVQRLADYYKMTVADVIAATSVGEQQLRRMSVEEADQLYDFVRAMTLTQLFSLWRWLYLEIRFRVEGTDDSANL